MIVRRLVPIMFAVGLAASAEVSAEDQRSGLAISFSSGGSIYDAAGGNGSEFSDNGSPNETIAAPLNGEADDNRVVIWEVWETR